MKQKKMFFAAAILAASLISTTNAKAGSVAEGAYAGAFMGMGMGILQAKVTTLGASNNNSTSDTFETTRGGFGLSGIQGGGWTGYGFKTADDIYLGAEMSFAGTDEKIKLTSTTGIQEDDNSGGENDNTITSISAKRNWVAGGAVRVGYYLNSDTLFALSGGIAVSQLEVSIGSSKETYYGGGPQVGASLETNISKIDPNLGLRMEFVYTDYLTADIQGQDNVSANNGSANNDSELTGHDTTGRVGITYRF
jgi:opacity protein-like surface antigen